MQPLFYKPHPALSNLVNNYMISHIKTDSTQKRITFPFPPLPEHCIFFYPFDKPTNEIVKTNEKRNHPGCLIVGPNTDRLKLTLGYNHLVVKIGFQPGGLYRLLGIPMEEMLVYKELDGKDFFGGDIKDTIEQLSAAADNTERIAIVEKFLFTRITKLLRPLQMDVVLPEILKYGGLIKIDQLVQKACLSNRQFERVFKQRIGLSPKFFSRHVRFTKAWLMKERQPKISWTEIFY
jgi:AraC-like DNA-binding protein